MSDDGQFDVIEGGDGVYFLVDPETRDIRGHLQDGGDGWWTGVYAGHPKRLFVEAKTTHPWRDAAERLIGS